MCRHVSPLICASLLLAQSCISVTYAAENYEDLVDPGPYDVQTRQGRWIDESRDGRDVPWKAYLPLEMTDPAPVVVWSHGAGGTRNGGVYLGEHLASHGIASFHIQHRGSDAAAALEYRGDGNMVRDFLGSFSRNPDITVQRMRDVPFAVDQIERMAKEDFQGRLDSARIGISGHSYGAITTTFMAGQASGRRGSLFAEPRFLAGFAMSPSPPRQGSAEVAFDNMQFPLFHLTGTDDQSPIGDLAPEDRQRPFQIIDDVDQYLLVLTDATHSTFSGRQRGNPSEELHHDLIRLAAVVFWRAYLEDDREALRWLGEGGYEAAVGTAGVFEFKSADR